MKTPSTSHRDLSPYNPETVRRAQEVIQEAYRLLPDHQVIWLWSLPENGCTDEALGEWVRLHPLWQQALTEAGPCWATDDSTRTWADLRASGFRSLILLPLGGPGLGVPACLAFLHPDPAEPDAATQRALALLGRYGYSRLAGNDGPIGEPGPARQQADSWVDDSLDLITSISFDGRFLYVNAGARRILGYAPDELVGRYARDFIHPPDVETSSAEMNQLREGKSTVQFQNRYVRKDGSLVWLEWNVIPDREARLARCIARDLSQTKRQELLLKENEQRYRSLFDNNPDAVFWFDLTGRFIDANPAFEQMLGYPLAEVTQLDFLPMVVPEDRPRVSANFKAAAQGISLNYDAVAMDRQGRRIPVNVTNVPILVDDEVVGVYGVAKDISARVKNESELRAQHRRQVAVAQIGKRALEGLPLKQLLAETAELVRHTLGVDASRITEVIKETGDLAVQTVSGWKGGRVGATVPGGAFSHCGYAVMINEPVIVQDLERESRFTPCQDLRATGFPCGVSVVIHAQGRPFGTIDVYSATPHDFSPDEIHFLLAVGNTLGLAAQRQRYEEQLRWIAEHDPLTNLVNRRTFTDRLQKAVAQWSEGGGRGAVMFLDLDHYKEINDTYDHRAGDSMLVKMTHALQQEMGPGQTLARLGGDEFAILLPGADQSVAEEVAGRLTRTVQAHGMLLDGQPVMITASIGIALYPDHGTSPDELLAMADMAMYRAKGEGGDRYAVYLPEFNLKSAFAARRTWELRIREALEYDRFEVVCQAISPLSSQPLPHFECLLRMKTADGETVLPSLFLPIAERSGLIVEIDRWVAKHAIRIAARLEKEGKPSVLQVNVSGKALDDKQLLNVIRQELQASGVNPAHLVFEVTESTAVTNVAAAREFILALRALGCKFALDDFGRGYSSFSQLKQLPFDYLKIDGNFVRQLATDSVDRHLVKAMVEVGHGLGKAVIAEWVETAEALDLLREMKVDFVQGYYVGKPGQCNGCWHNRPCHCRERQE